MREIRADCFVVTLAPTLEVGEEAQSVTTNSDSADTGKLANVVHEACRRWLDFFAMARVSPVVGTVALIEHDESLMRRRPAG